MVAERGFKGRPAGWPPPAKQWKHCCWVIPLNWLYSSALSRTASTREKLFQQLLRQLGFYIERATEVLNCVKESGTCIIWIGFDNYLDDTGESDGPSAHWR